MNKADAAALLSLEESEVHDVLDSPAGVLIKTTDGQTYIVVPEDNPDADGKVGVMFLAAPSPKYGGTFPVYAQPGAEAEIRSICDARSFQDLAEEAVAGEELDDPENADADAAAAAAAAQAADKAAKEKLAEAQSELAEVQREGQPDEPAPAPGPEHAEDVEKATTKGAGEQAAAQAKTKRARAGRAAKQVEKKA